MPLQSPLWRAPPTPLVWFLLLNLCCCGCARSSSALRHCAFRESQTSLPTAALLLEESKRFRQTALEFAEIEDACCVDWYFVATRSAWRAAIAAEAEGAQVETRTAASAQYHHCLRGLLYTGQKFGRLDPRTGLRLGQGEEKIVVPAVHHGFPWPADDFLRITSPPQDLPKLLECRYSRPGCGVPLVVQRCRNPHDPDEVRFFIPQSSFAATALLRFTDGKEGQENGAADSVGSAVLEFHDPLRVSKASLPEGSLPLAGDLTAPLAEMLNDNPRTYLAGFVQSGGGADPSKLSFLEPYQKGKPPVVFIHGLFSDPQGWASLVNDLRAIPGFCDRYQIWFFRYPTGQGFLRSAAELREELQAAVHACDPHGTDPALQEMVLVGHSMGGLISKLQVTHSDDTIWRRLANRPLDAINTDEATRTKLALTCFFEPLPSVRRVIFVATPHCGSNDASGLVGDVATLLVRESPKESQTHEQLMEQNPGVFADFVQKRFPTSIDLLKPESPLLAAMQEMRIGKGVQLHTIVGVTPYGSLGGPSDGVVRVTSARHPGVASESTTPAPHAKVHRAPETSREVARILAEHLHEK